jgi:hypothetical protein
VHKDANFSGPLTLVLQSARCAACAASRTQASALTSPLSPATIFQAPSAAAGVLNVKQALKAVVGADRGLPAAELLPGALAALVVLLEPLQHMKLLDTLSACVLVRQGCSGCSGFISGL